MAQTPLSIRRWKRTEYDRLVELGIFDGEPLELIAGHLIVAEPQGSYHAGVINVIADVLRAALPMGLAVRVQSPIALDEDSEPEPDVAVVSGGNADYLLAHPERPLLLVEVADSSLRFDRREKESLYARGGVQDYWIVNLVDRVLEVHRTPIQDDAAVYGWSYQSVERLIPGATVALLALPSIRVGVSELLPSV